MNYILFDDHNRNDLLPLTFMRPVADLRCGILTFREKWNNHLGTECSVFTAKYLRKKFPLLQKEQNIFINGSLFPHKMLIDSIHALRPGQALKSATDDSLLAFSATNTFFDTANIDQFDTFSIHVLKGFQIIEYEGNFQSVTRPWHIFSMNDQALRDDFHLLTTQRQSQPISSTNRVFAPENIFIEEGAIVEFSVINAASGPVYIGKDAEVMENCAIRAPFALCKESVLKMGAKIYGATTIGPHCKVGGEVNNSVIFGFSNKAHDGFLGNSVIGEWCNLGADTNNSNLKNTYDIVKIWSYPEKHFVSTGLQFCGLIMGDHSKSAINTMFNTGTVVGVSSNIFGEGFPRQFIPSFSWGGASGFKKYNLEKAIEVARQVCERRNVILSEIDVEIFETLYALSD
jgi:UDP-N-acetylglucosamine diphosphorylase/glucosamine-1-phosphate N-acetyltransferase